jgi:hypothetical protein
MEKPNTIQIEGTTYRVQINDDDDCPVSLSRIYKTGERRTVVTFGTRMVQIKQADGSWWNHLATR